RPCVLRSRDKSIATERGREFVVTYSCRPYCSALTLGRRALQCTRLLDSPGILQLGRAGDADGMGAQEILQRHCSHAMTPYMLGLLPNRWSGSSDRGRAPATTEIGSSSHAAGFRSLFGVIFVFA